MSHTNRAWHSVNTDWLGIIIIPGLGFWAWGVAALIWLGLCLLVLDKGASVQFNSVENIY